MNPQTKILPTKYDLIAGVSVALVLVPQSLAYAQLAGLPAYVGLFASTIPLIVFSFLASSPYLQTGPVALTSLLTFSALNAAGFDPADGQYLKLAALLAIVVGVYRILIGALKLGWLTYLICTPVMRGFIAGAAVVITASQLPRGFGTDALAPEGSILRRAFWTLSNPSEWNTAAIALTMLTLVFMYGGRKLHKLFPGVLLAAICGIIAVSLTDYSAPIVGQPIPIPNSLPEISLSLPWSDVTSLLIGGLIIALVGFAEPSSIARTYANQDNIPWSANRELIASGVANTAAGFVGAYPVGGSFSRSSLNRMIGAKTRWSGGITGIVVLGFLPFASLLDNLPQAVLGAIVMGAVLKLIDLGGLKEVWDASKSQAMLTLITFAATIAISPDIQWALILGVVLTVAYHHVYKFKVETIIGEDNTAIVKPTGLLWYFTSASLQKSVEATVKQHHDKKVIVDLINIPAVEAEDLVPLGTSVTIINN